MTTTSLEARIGELRNQIAGIHGESMLSGRLPLLLGACKSQPAPVIARAIDAGMTDFGENRVQEAVAKWPDLKERYPSVRLHLIGPLQSNKVKEAVELFDVIQTLDREKLADALAEAMVKTGQRIPCLIQVNTGEEPQKNGVSPKESDRLIDYCLHQLRLPISGLMCVPPADQPAAPHFALLRSLALAHGLEELSMGMSEDFETAIRFGSTCVRLGRALFGERA